MSPRLPWPVSAVVAGAAGTAVLTLAYRTEHRLRPSVERPLDYDDSLVPGEIVANVLHLPSVTAREEDELGTLLRWGYGSAFGVVHGFLRRTIGEPWASLVFGGAILAKVPLCPFAASVFRRHADLADVLAT